MITQSSRYISKSGKFLRSSNNKPCPICNDTKGKCQVNYDDDFVLCMDTHTAVNGWHFIGVNKSGVWGMHSLTSVIMSEQERLNRKIEREKSERLRKESFKKESLPVADRDKAFRAISNELGLSRADRKRLIDRGLTDEQVSDLHSFSLRGKTQVSDNIPSNLPGVNIDRKGNKYLYCDDGFFTTAFDFEGNIIGGQTRSNLTNNGGKYKWLKGVKSSHLPNGELPVTFIRGNNQEAVNQLLKDLGIDEELKPVFALEGFLKPYVGSCRFGVDTIGAAGFNFNSGIEQVREIITRGGYNCVILPLDGGAVINPMIMNQLAKNVKIFEDLGCKVFIGWWGQTEKSDRDFDEINSLEQVRLIDYGTVKTISESAMYRQWKKEELTKLRGFKSDKTIDKKRFYDEGAISDSEIDAILDNHQSIIIQGGKASGKSYMKKQYIKRWRSSGGKVINIGCRRVLCESQSTDWELTYILDAEKESYSLPVIFERDGGLSVVIDSLLKLKNIDWENTLIILDEFEQFVSHLLTSNTSVKDYRGYILQFLEDCFKLSLATGGKIIASDADSSDISSDWLEGVTGIKPFKLKNINKSHNNNCFIFAGDKSGYDDLIKNIFNDLANKEKIFVASDSRKDLEALLIEVQKEFPNLPCEIVTSDTVAEAYIRNFIKSPDKAIEETQVLMLGASPVMQSGVSIDIKGYFSKVYGICTGIIEPSIMRQLLIRVRDNCDRYLWIADKARGIYSNDFDYQKILASKDNFIQSLPEIAQYVTALNENLTNAELLDKIKELLDRQNNLCDINSVTKAKLTARRNLALSNYRAVLIEELRDEGYVIHDDYESQTTSVVSGVDLAVTKKDIDMNKAIAVDKAEDISKFEQERLKNKPYITKDEQNQLLKYAIKDNFPLVAINPLFILNYIIKDNWQTLKAVKRSWFAQNKEVARDLDRKAIHYQHKVALTGGKFWLQDIKPNMHYVALFERLGLSELINDNLPVNKNSEQLKALFERCKDYRKIDGISNRELLRNCGVKFSNNVELVNLLRKVLKLFGYKLECVDRTEDDKGSTVRHYSIIQAVNSELWQQLMDSFDFKYQQLEPINYDFDLENNEDYNEEFFVNTSFESENAETYTGNELELAPLPTNFVKENNSSGAGLNQDSVSDSGVLTEKLIFEPKLSENNRELIGRKCNFWNNNNQWVTGFIVEILDFAIKLKDSHGVVSYCNLSQIEVLNDDFMHV